MSWTRSMLYAVAAAMLLPGAAVTGITRGAGWGSADESLRRSPGPGVESRALRLTVAGQGNEARYRVREQLVGIDFPSDAVGVTTAIRGGLTLADDGSVVVEESEFVVDVTTLTSDSGMRDRYIGRRTLQTAEHPEVTFVPTEIRNLPVPAPSGGESTLEVAGDLTVRGMTRAVVWSVTARASEQGYSGSATTAFTFADFGMDKPRVGRVLSVQDTIRLEYDFNLLAER